jgi:integrase
MATIREHGNKYQVQIRKKGHKPISKSFLKRIDAEAWARKTESEMERGVWRDTAAADEKSLAAVLIDYRDGHGSEVRDKEIPARIDAIIARWPACEKLSMSVLNRTSINDYIGMRRGVVSGSTINKELGIISAAINRAISNGLPVENPIEKVIRPKNNQARNRRLAESETDEDGRQLKEHELRSLLRELKPRTREAGRLGAGVDNPRIRWIVRFAIETAMRRGELLSLTWKNVFLKKNYVHLPKTKNGKPRDVPLSTRAIRCLWVLKKMSDGEERVFPFTESALRKTFDRACARAKIEDLHFHDLRHEATSRLARFLDMGELTKMTGHDDPRVLMRYYHPRAEDMAKKLP